MFDLAGRNVLLTGATGGIGQEVGRSLHGRGARIVLSGTRLAVLEELASDLGEGAFPVACNLADPGACKELVVRATDLMGSVDVLVNNAGINRDNLLLRMSDSNWHEVLDVDLTAAMRLARSSLRGMLRKRWGRIISITSIVGQTGNAGQANYAAAKAGLAGFSRSLALEVGARGITVNCIAPGYIATAMTKPILERNEDGLVKTIPSRRIGLPSDVAAAVVYLASEEASYVTGQTLNVNGGLFPS